jgi:succinate dehydrogenase / fumarate reductase, cytochrome b subunit
MSNIFAYSIGKKLIMSLAGLFLITFLVVHLGINLLLVFSDSRDMFNIAAHFMASNIAIKVFEIVLFGGFLIHMLYGVITWLQNYIARGADRYKVSNNAQTSFFSKYMIHTAIIVGIFLVLHLMDFYIKAKFLGEAPVVMINGKELHDLGLLVIRRFQIGWVVGVYIVALLGLAFHLHHGFQSAFQTIGFNHEVYTPVIKVIGLFYSILIPAGFIFIALYTYYHF